MGTAARLTERLRAAGCVFAEEESALLLASTDDPELLERRVTRRTAGEPLEHVLGRVELAGRSWSVGPGVFVPRRRSERLVAAALDLPAARADATVVDLCCGSGAIGGALLLGLPDGGRSARLHAADVDPRAVAHARANVAPWGGTVSTGDLWDALPDSLRGRVDLLLCHAPYVPTSALATLPAEARDHEPRAALDGGHDGLDVLRRVVAGAPPWLARDGALLFEVAGVQVAAATRLVTAAGLRVGVLRDEETDGAVMVASVAAAG